MSVFNISLDVVEHECPECYMTYFITNLHDKRLRRTGQTFYCPNGHPASFKDTEMDRMRALVKHHEQTINELIREKAELRTELNKKTKPARKRKAKQ